MILKCQDLLLERPSCGGLKTISKGQTIINYILCIENAKSQQGFEQSSAVILLDYLHFKLILNHFKRNIKDEGSMLRVLKCN